MKRLIGGISRCDNVAPVVNPPNSKGVAEGAAGAGVATGVKRLISGLSLCDNVVAVVNPASPVGVGGGPMGTAAGASVGPVVVAGVAAGVLVGITTAVGVTGSSGPPPLAKATPMTAATATATTPTPMGTTPKRRQPPCVGRPLTCRRTMVPSFSMKNCSTPGFPEKFPSGRKDRVTT